MPLFNPANLTVTAPTGNSQALKLQLLSQAEGTATADGTILVAAETTGRVLVTVTNGGVEPIYIGFTNNTSETQYIAKVQPAGVYETPIGYFGPVYIWAENGANYTTSTFTQILT